MNDAVALARWLVCPEREALPACVSAAQAEPRAADALAQLAREHGLAPWLHQRARQQALAFVPSLAATLATEYRASLARNTYFAERLREVSAVCAALDADVIALKGIHLAALVYPALATRPMVDLDVLIERGDLPRVIEAMQARGYRVASPEPRAGTLTQFENLVLLARGGEQAHSPIGLHWSLLDDPFYQERLRVDDFRARALAADLSGVRCKVFAPEALLVYLSAHLALHHRWSRLLWECDIVLVLAQQPALDWALVLQLAQANALSLALRETLRRVSEHFALEIPPEVRTRLEHAPISSAERRAWHARAGEARRAGRAFWFDLQGIEGTRARALFALAHLFPSPAYMAQRYALSRRAQLPLAYARRWWRGLRSLGARG